MKLPFRMLHNILHEKHNSKIPQKKKNAFQFYHSFHKQKQY
jgi:hypothetical protein